MRSSVLLLACFLASESRIESKGCAMGSPLQWAQTEMTAISKQLQRQHAIVGRDLNASVTPFSEVVVADERPLMQWF